LSGLKRGKHQAEGGNDAGLFIQRQIVRQNFQGPPPVIIFATQTTTNMATTTETTAKGKYWVFFLISLVIFLFMLIFMNQWFWVSMPFMLTYLVLALGYM
jgi:hypothetical protein